jgi:aminoglycoside phosphotransferase family enzyme/predicted kinase
MQTTGIALAQAMVTALARTLHAQIIETHISWVLLAKDLAYKIKKPVRLPFVDYGTLDARRGFCEEEVRLNRRLAASLYLGVSRITGTHRLPEVDGPGPVLEYAVRMLRFAPGALFGEQLAAGELTPRDVDQLAGLLGDFHEHAPRTAADNGFGSVERRRTVALAALDGAAPVATTDDVVRLRDWLETQAAALAPLWSVRLESGRVREGHGDLHLDNVVSLDGGVAAFDCIEFDPALRWIDVIDDIAFPVMDFGAQGRSDFGFRLLNGWLDRTGDHGAVAALPFSAVYRALVRAQVEHLRGAGRAARARRFVDAALSWMQPRSPQLCITHGLPGSGKTFQSQRLLEREGAIRLRSDVERKRLFGLGMLEDSRSRGLDLYSREATARTYEYLFATARTLLQAGWPVVLDAAFLLRAERELAFALARELQVPFSILDCQAPPHVLRERLSARRDDASEADGVVLEKLHAIAQPLEQGELALVRAAGDDTAPAGVPAR